MFFQHNQDQDLFRKFNLEVIAKVEQGHGISSGRNTEKYPGGSISAQKPHFKERGLNIDHYFSGTINLALPPGSTFEIIEPDLRLEQVKWWPDRIPESFSFVNCWIRSGVKWRAGTLYCPDPKTKVSTVDNPRHLQILTTKIEGLSYGHELVVRFDEQKLRIVQSSKNLLY